MYRLYSLCAVYRVDMEEALSWYGDLAYRGLPADAVLTGTLQDPFDRF